MKKTLIFGAATAAVALSLGSCAVTSCTQMSTLYGPPPVQEDDEPIEDVYGPPVTDVELQPALYGPPVTD